MSSPAPPTDAEFEQHCATVCVHCGANIAVRKRADTGEWVHDEVIMLGRKIKGHTLCMAHALRSEREKMANG